MIFLLTDDELLFNFLNDSFENICKINGDSVISGENLAIVVNNPSHKSISHTKNSVVILDFNDAKNISNIDALPILCSSSPKATFSVSSNRENSITLSLNRDFKTVSGRKISPQEYNINKDFDYPTYYFLFKLALSLFFDK